MAGTSPALKHLQARQHQGVFFPLFAKGVWGCGRAVAPARMGRIQRARELNLPGTGQKLSLAALPPTHHCYLPAPAGLAAPSQRWQMDVGTAEGTPTVCGVARRETSRKMHRWKGDAR